MVNLSRNLIIHTLGWCSNILKHCIGNCDALDCPDCKSSEASAEYQVGHVYVLDLLKNGHLLSHLGF